MKLASHRVSSFLFLSAIKARLCSSEQFQLHARWHHLNRLISAKQVNVAKLLVRDRHDSYIAGFGEKRLHALHVNECILHAGTVTAVDGKLKHNEAVLYQVRAKLGGIMPVLLCLCW